MSQFRRAGDIVCLADPRRPHVLARATLPEGSAVPDLEMSGGVEWFAGEMGKTATVHFTCKHGEAQVDLIDFAREMKSSRRRARRTVNRA